MCRTYQAEENETVFELPGMLVMAIVGVVWVAISVIMLIVISQTASGFATFLPIISLCFGIGLLAYNGGRWLVFNKERDEIIFIRGYLLNFVSTRTVVGKISSLTSILSTLRIQVSRHHHHHHNSHMHHSTTHTQVYRNVTLHFSSGGSFLVGAFPSETGGNEFIMKIKHWLDTNYSNHQVRCGDADALSQQPIVIQQTVVNPNQILEQELRSLIVQYQMSNDSTAKAKGQKLNLAMEYNSNSLIGTYGALKQQSPVFTIQGEEILLNSAQTIIDAKTNQVQVQFHQTNEGVNYE